MLDIPQIQLSNRAALLFSAKEQVDVLESITHFFSKRLLPIVSTQQFTIDGVLYLRLEWQLDEQWENEEAFSHEFGAFAKHFDAQFQVKFFNRKQSMGLFVEAQDHCLKAVLNLWQLDYFAVLDISFIVGGDESARYYADRHAVPFFATEGEGLEREKKQLEIVQRYSPELIGLAAYKNPLSARFLDQTKTATIFDVDRAYLLPENHRDSLSAVYQQGVKLVGASSRMVHAEVDGGQIIEQGTQRLDDAATFAEFKESINLIEQRVFCQALAKLLQHKVLVKKNRCVVFT